MRSLRPRRCVGIVVLVIAPIVPSAVSIVIPIVSVAGLLLSCHSLLLLLRSDLAHILSHVSRNSPRD